MSEWSKNTRYSTEAFDQNKKNLIDNKHKGKVSAKSMKEIKNSVNWLVHASESKMLWHKESQRTYNFKVNFITLTLPDTNKNITDLVFKRDLLEPLLASLRKNYGLKNYVWKLELQENGKLHAHITTDTFIWWRDLRNLWNKRLAAIGIIKAYKEKFCGCTFNQYLQLCSSLDKRSLNEKRKSWEASTKANWSDPNSTDIHAVYKIDDVAAYISKYMAKDSDKLSQVKGRIWGCSYGISRNRKPSVFIDRHSLDPSIRSLFSKKIRWSPLEMINPKTQLPKQIGEIFFVSQDDWLHNILGSVSETYKKTIRNLRRPNNLFESDSVDVSTTLVHS